MIWDILIFLWALAVVSTIPLYILGTMRQDDYRARYRGYERRRHEAAQRGERFDEEPP